MTPSEFIGRIYLGDRGIHSIELIGDERTVRVNASAIAVIKPGRTHWAPDDGALEIEPAVLLFSGVESVRFEPAGPVPNDYFTDFTVTSAPQNVVAGPTEVPLHTFKLSADSVNDQGDPCEICMTVVAQRVCLLDPRDDDRVVLSSD